MGGCSNNHASGTNKINSSLKENQTEICEIAITCKRKMIEKPEHYFALFFIFMAK